MDGFIFYILLVIVTALASMLCSCLWKNYRNRAFAAWQAQQIQQQQFLAYQQQQLNAANRPVVIGIFQGSSDMPFVIRPSDNDSSLPTPQSAPPAYSDVVSHPEVYLSQNQQTDDVNGAKSAEELPPPYSEIRR